MTTRVVTVHSFRRGAGKSTMAANLAVVLARSGLRVALVDTNRRVDHVGLRLGHALSGPGFVDAVVGRIDTPAALHDLTREVDPSARGALAVLPGGEHIAAHDDHDPPVVVPEAMAAVFRAAVDDIDADVLILDSESGLTEETMALFAVTDDLLVLVRPDREDHQGSAVILDVARRMGVPRPLLVLSHVTDAAVDPEEQAEFEDAFGVHVLGVLPFVAGLAEAAPAAPYVLRRFDSRWSGALGALAASVVGAHALPPRQTFLEPDDV